MLLKKKCGRQLSALSLCLAVMFAPLLTAQADEPEIVPTDSSATTGAQPTSLSQPLDQSPATAIMAVLSRCRKASTPNRSASSCSRGCRQATRLSISISSRCFMPPAI